jgi:pyruvate formate lyase activating enzyme
MDKRQFLKTTLLGAGGMTCAACPLLSHASEFLAPQVGEKWTKEAFFYVTTPKGIRCQLCPNECDLKEGETGDCRNRTVKNGKLYTIAYGNPCAVHIDPVEKKPLMHFLPGSRTLSVGTAGCNLACLNCQNWTISQKSPTETRNYDLLPEKLVTTCQENQCESLAYTYSEPITFYEYTYDSSILARQAGIKNIIVTAGYINREPLEKLCKVIDAANVDLKSFSDDIYLRLNAGKLQPVLDTLKTLKNEGVWLEITNLIVPSWTDDLDMIKRMCGWLVENGFENNPLHFSRFYPTYKLTQLPPTPVAVLRSAFQIAKSEGIKHVYIGNVPGTEAQHTYCPECGKIVIERKGYTIVNNHIVNGKCTFCQTPIPGIWE